MSSTLMKYVLPPKSYPGSYIECNRKTIILDLDSTLVYTFIDRPEGYNGQDCWFVDEVIEEDNSVTKYYVLIRPYAKRFLERCMGHYNVVFFTAAEREYAEPIFNMLCPEISQECRYYRDSCIMQSSVYMKDLTLLTGFHFDEKKVFLFDDNAPDNTIPRENGMFCSQFAPEDENDNSRVAINTLLEDKALEAFADLFCSDRFLKAEDIRIPLAEYDDLYKKRLAEFGEVEQAYNWEESPKAFFPLSVLN